MRKITALLAVVCALAVLLPACGRGEEEAKAVTALAMNDDPEATVQAVLYLGDPDKHAFQLPQGEYLLLAMDADGNIAEVHASLPSDGVIPLDKIVFGSSATKEQREVNEENMGKLLEFFAVNEYSVLSYMERMLRTEGELSDEDVAAQFDEIAELRTSLEGAIGGLEYFSEGSSVGRASPLYVMGPTLSTLPAPAAGKVSVLWEWRKWTKTLWAPATDSRDKVVEGMAALPDDRHRQLLLNKINPEERRALGVPDDVSEFLKKLKDGDLDSEAHEIHKALFDASGSLDPSDPEALDQYLNHAQNTKSRPLDLAHKHGKKMVEQGMKFNLAVWKEMIAAAKGGEKTKAALTTVLDKSVLVYDLLAKPGEKVTKLSIKKILAEGLKDELENMGVPADEIEGVLGVLTDWLYDKLKTKDPSLVEGPEVTATAEAVFSAPTPEASPAPVAVASPTATPPPTASPGHTIEPTLEATPTPTATPQATAVPEETATATPASDTGWIEGYVQGVANQWLDKGYDGIDVAVAADDLRGCLTDDVVNWGLSKDEAIADCPTWLFEPSWTPEPTETATPEAKETPTAEPTPTPQPTATAAPGEELVRAEGPWLVSYELGDDCEVKKNEMWLTFPSGGGEVSGEGHWVLSCESVCGPITTYQDTEYKGNYSPDSGILLGTSIMDITGNHYSDEETCEPQTSTSQSGGTWQTTFEGGGLTGDFGHLTVQGQ